MPKLPNKILSIIENGFADKEHKLIGNQDFTDEEYSAMVDVVGNLCRNNSFQKTDHKLIFLTLVEIAKRWKETENEDNNEENSGFWCFVFKTLTGIDEYNQSLYSQFTSLISEMGQRNQTSVVKTGKKYYATLMMHAFAPKKSIHSFFDLCYNVYKKDLDFDFTSDDEWLCEIVALQITSVLQNGYREDRAVSIGSSAYSIKIGLRSFALHEDLFQNFVQFIKDTFEQINKLFNREIIAEETRLQRYIVKWWKNKTEKEKVSDSTIRKKRITTVSKQNITTKYIRNEDKVLLCIPPIRLDNENDIMRLSVYINDEQHCSEDMRTKRGELVVSTKEKEFDLNDLLKYSESINIRVKITENEAILYDSKETLNREFILFEDEKEIFSQINKPSNYFVYSKNIDGLKSTPQELTTYSTNLYNIYPTAGENLTGTIKQVLFVDKAKVAKSSNTVCLLGNLPDIEWVLDDIHCLVYKDSVKLIVPENTNLKALELKIDSKTYKLDTLDYVLLENNAYMFGLLKLGLLKPNEPIELSLYSYEKGMTVLTEMLIVLSNLEIKFSNSVFYGNVERKITVSDSKSSNDFSWSNQDNEIICPLSDGNLLVKIPCLKWRIADKEWHNDIITRKLWHKDFLQNGDLLEIDTPKEDEEIKLFIKSDGQKTEIPKNQSGKFEIGRVIYANDNKKEIFVYLASETTKYDLFTISTKEHFVENPISYINGKVYWNVEDTFVGDKDNEFFLAIKSGRNNFRNKISNKNSEIVSIYEDICKIQVKIKDKNIFSKDEKYDTVFETDKFIIGNPKQFRFKNKCLKIEYVSSQFSNDESWIRPQKDYGIYNLKFVEETDEGKAYEYYEGILGIIKDNVISCIEYMENENDESEKINPVRIELRSNNTFWLKAGYDKDNDFYNENLLLNTWKELSFRNINEHKVVNLYKFKELEIN
jgi:hypothetical protein